MTLKRETRPVESEENTSGSTDTTPKAIIDIRVITHNIRYATSSPFKGEEKWPIRCPRLCSQLVFNSIPPETFICLQEVLHKQLLDILSSLNDANTSPKDAWDYIGVGRDDGKKGGEFSPIFYRPSVWKLESWQTRWLSKTPDVPSKGWDAGCIRLVTIGNFTHVSTGAKVTAMSTHLDNSGTKSREESAKLILKFIKELQGTVDSATVLLAGDFNSPENDGAYQIMTASESSMRDVALQIPPKKRYGDEMTFTSFGHVDNRPSRIDFIFSRKGDRVRYKTYGVLTNRFDDGVYLSDHRACVADFELLYG